jgi:hypothetical protein
MENRSDLAREALVESEGPREAEGGGYDQSLKQALNLLPLADQTVNDLERIQAKERARNVLCLPPPENLPEPLPPN